MSRQVYYDKVRHLNLVRVHHKGDMYVFNVPADLKLSTKHILQKGELISMKMKGKKYIRIDSTSDPYFRLYNLILPFEIDFDAKDAEDLIAERRKTAPIVGEETTYEPSITLDSGQYFKGLKIVKINQRQVVHAEKDCVKCGALIKGLRHVSFGTDGKPSRLQMFEPLDEKTAKPTGQGNKDWLCSNCFPPVEAAPPAPTPPAEPVAVISDDTETIKGFQWFTFTKVGDVYHYRGNPITVTDEHRFVLSHHECHKCKAPITLRATVTFRNDKPWCISANKPVGQAAKPLKAKSSYWLCEECLTGKPVPKIEPEIDDVKDTPPPAFELPVSVPEVFPTLTEPPIPVAATPPPEPAPVAVPTIPTFDNTAIFSQLEAMAMNSDINDKVFRGAAWMLCRSIGGQQ